MTTVPRDTSTCWMPGDQEHDHEMCKDVVAEQASYAYALRLMGEALRDLPDFRDVWVCIQPGLRDATDENRVRVDAVARALLGTDGEDEASGGGWKRYASGTFGPVRVSITAEVPGPPDERDAEIERLRAEVAELRAADKTGQLFSREPDDPTPGTVPAEIEGHSEYSGRASAAPQCLPGCYEPTLDVDHVPGCPVGGE